MNVSQGGSASLTHSFVEFIPDQLEERVIYISIPYATVVHRCCCGCGGEVVTPLSPRDWRLTFDGETVSLYPSIGNWSFACRSHYWIQRNRVVWAEDWSDERVESARRQERHALDTEWDWDDEQTASPSISPDKGSGVSWWKQVVAWWRRRRGAANK